MIEEATGSSGEDKIIQDKSGEPALLEHRAGNLVICVHYYDNRKNHRLDCKDREGSYRIIPPQRTLPALYILRALLFLQDSDSSLSP